MVLLFCVANLYAHENRLLALRKVLLTGHAASVDSVVINDIVNEFDILLQRKFKSPDIDRFYESVEAPEQYFIQMENILGWSFRKSMKYYYRSIIEGAQNIKAIGYWQQMATKRFIIYYQAGIYNGLQLKALGDYLEQSLDEIKAQLLIPSDEDGVLDSLIRSFYPEKKKWYAIPDEPEKTGARIQIVLFPGPREYQEFFGKDGVEQDIGGTCSFSIYRKPGTYSSNVLYNLRVAVIFAGYSTFPFLTHELAHAVRFIYYTDLSGIEPELVRIDSIYEAQGREAYYTRFWPVFKGRIPGSNGILEEAIAYRAMFQTGPIGRARIVPPIADLLTSDLEFAKTLISTGARATIDVGFLSLIAQKLGISDSAERKVGDAVFAWADFLSYLEASNTPENLRSLYNTKSEDISPKFLEIFGISIQQAEVEWISARIP